jgi:hypothetical protein
MSRKKNLAPAGPKPNDGWIYATHIQVHGRNVSPGTELKIRGERGRFRFVHRILTERGVEWIDVWGGKKGAEQMRSFKLDRIKTVHYKNQTVQNLAFEYKEKQKIKKSEESN